MTIWYHVAVITLSTENFVTFIILTIHRRNMIFASKVCNNTIFTEKMNKNDFGHENSEYDFFDLVNGTSSIGNDDYFWPLTAR